MSEPYLIQFKPAALRQIRKLAPAIQKEIITTNVYR
jgi:hypothetical protein